MSPEFTDFVAAEGDDLARLARLLCGGWAEAEDLVQATLLRCFRAWPRLSVMEDPHAYARRVLINLHRSWWRSRLRRREQSRDVLPERGYDGGFDRVDARLALLDALARLPRRQREVVVLRYYGDLPEREVATTLGCSVGTVKSQAAKGLASLRKTVAAPSRESEVRP